MIEYIPEIVKSGVRSIKIEGRMKRPEYVAVVIDHYRKTIDSYYEDPGNFSVDPNTIKELDQAFSRGAGSGHYFGKLSQDGMSWEKPNNAGIPAGKVVSFKGGKAHIKLIEDLNIGDGFVIDSYNGPQAGEITISGKKGETIEISFKSRLRLGELLYKTRDSILQKKARDTFSSSRVTNKQYIDVMVTVKEGENINYKITDEKGNIVEGQGTVPAEKALKRPLTEETILEQFSRLGNTPYEIRSLTADIKGEAIVPLRELNNIRKDFTEKLQEASLSEFNTVNLPDYDEFIKKMPILTERDSKKDKKLSVSLSSLEGVKAAIEGGADIIYLYLETLRSFKKLSEKDISEAIELCENKCEINFIIPGIIKEGQLDYYENLVKSIYLAGGKNFSVANLSGLSLLEDISPEINGEYTLNTFNSWAVDLFEKEGVRRITLSPELSLDQLNHINNSEIEKEVLIQGNFPLITTEYCVLESSGYCMKKNKSPEVSCSDSHFFKDRKNFNMPLAFDYNCKMYLYNVKELSLYRDMEKIIKSKIDVYRIEGRLDSPDNIYQKTKMYKEQIDLYNKRGNVKIKKDNIEKMSALSPEGLTAGHLFRGVE